MYLGRKPKSIKDLRNPIGEEIFGDWQPSGYRQTVYLHYDDPNKKTALNTGKFKVYYLIYDNPKGFSSSKRKVSFAIDGKSGEYLDKESKECFESKEYSIDYKLSNEILQQKIAPNGFDAINRGLENDDVTCYILSYINGKYKDKQREDIQFRFVHGGDGYWEDYFLKLEKKGCIPYKTKKVKFLCDLELEDSSVKFAIVPINIMDIL